MPCLINPWRSLVQPLQKKDLTILILSAPVLMLLTKSQRRTLTKRTKSKLNDSTKIKKKLHLHIETISVNLMSTEQLLHSIVSKSKSIEKILMKTRESFKIIVRKSVRLVHVVIKIKSFQKKTSMIIEKNSCSNSTQFQKIVIVTLNTVKER